MAVVATALQQYYTVVQRQCYGNGVVGSVLIASSTSCVNVFIIDGGNNILQYVS